MNSQPETLTALIERITAIIQLAIPIIVALALLFFVWGLMQVIFSNVDNKEEMKKGKNRMIWGVIVLFIMLSVAGILAVFQRTFFGNSLDGSGGSYRSPSSYESRYGPPGSIRGGGFVYDEPNKLHFCLFGRIAVIGECPRDVR